MGHVNSLKHKVVHSPPFAGIQTFAKFPLLKRGNIDINEKSFAIIGAPYDMGSTDYPGSRNSLLRTPAQI